MVPHTLRPAIAPRNLARSASLHATAASGSAREVSQGHGDPRERAVFVFPPCSRHACALDAPGGRSPTRVSPPKAEAARCATRALSTLFFAVPDARRLP
jgi:hypothetical protein